MSDKPLDQRPETPDFWDKRFAARTTPWDAGGVPADLMAFASTVPGAPRVLIPGCGSAWEARWLMERGWRVTALDFSAAAMEVAREVLGDHGACLLHADFFHFDAGEGYDILYERAFKCALPRKMWQDYARRCAVLLPPGGLLAGFFFFRDDPKGPPFGTSPEALRELLSPWFECLEDRPAAESIAVFSGFERWQVWRRL
ncbi:MAG: methyltransferase domain-containing protein [Rhodocyclaceae bacterium]|nr:methyltransferase domain-containing protein [Rhodocyclaceae bacterium]